MSFEGGTKHKFCFLERICQHHQARLLRSCCRWRQLLVPSGPVKRAQFPLHDHTDRILDRDGRDWCRPEKRLLPVVVRFGSSSPDLLFDIVANSTLKPTGFQFFLLAEPTPTIYLCFPFFWALVHNIPTTTPIHLKITTTRDTKHPTPKRQT